MKIGTPTHGVFNGQDPWFMIHDPRNTHHDSLIRNSVLLFILYVLSESTWILHRNNVTSENTNVD